MSERNADQYRHLIATLSSSTILATGVGTTLNGDLADVSLFLDDGRHIAISTWAGSEMHVEEEPA